MAVVKLLIIDPISNVPAVIRLRRSLFKASIGFPGSKSGRDANAKTSPVCIFKITAPAAIAL